MSDNHQDKPTLTQETTDDQEVSDALAAAEDSQNMSENRLPRTSLEDTGESAPLQEQETRAPQNNGAQSPLKPAQKRLPEPACGTNEAVSIELRRYAHVMNDYLTWKENLRITSVDLQIGGPYFDLWTKEANLFFRRLVILRKRIESIKKQKRA
ncbi:MAG: hypothetical protein H7249_07930 [Chitinophagaceae bacterium]|nr:hypothetical protein [Oligoflexus sp.]